MRCSEPRLLSLLPVLVMMAPPIPASSAPIEVVIAGIERPDEAHLRLPIVETRLLEFLSPGLIPVEGFEFIAPRVEGPLATFFRTASGDGDPELVFAFDVRGPWLPVVGAVLSRIEPTYPELGVLAAGSREAQESQQEYAAAHSLPAEVRNSIGMRLRLVPPGEFLMGSPETELGRDGDEEPQHLVQIAYPMWIGAHEVTADQWRTLMAEARGEGSVPVGANWSDAQRFVDALNLREGGGYRLLSEAEWEYACRAGTATAFYGGEYGGDTYDDPVLDPLAWYGPRRPGDLMPVGLKIPNAWGLYDMHGNAEEWVEDSWHPSYEGAPSDGSAWADDPSAILRVLRGGHVTQGPAQCRSASRGWYARDTWFPYGFRLCRELAGRFQTGPTSEPPRVRRHAERGLRAP